MADRDGARPVDLRCEGLYTPLAVHSSRPRLSWRIQTDVHPWRQAAYRILCASAPRHLQRMEPDLWDSGRVESDRSVHVPFGGGKLTSGDQVFWKVRVWDQSGNPSEWSEPARWEMGLLEADDWQACWIGAPHEPWHSITSTQYDPAPYFRTAFDYPGAVRRARLHICGVGYHEVYLNGKRVGDHMLDPAVTRYDRRLKYVTHDVTEMIEARNALGVILGNGWYNMHVIDNKRFFDAPWRGRPRSLLQLEIDGENGNRRIVSDESWKYARGPITFDSVRSGETYDAGRNLGAWDEPGYDDSTWRPVEKMAAPGGELSPQLMPPMRVTETITPISVSEADGCHIFDLGRIIAGRAQFNVRGTEDDEIVLKYRERPPEADPGIDDAGPDHVGNDIYVLCGDFQTDRYISGGQGPETWEPRFTYHGFRYIEVSGLHDPDPDDLKGRVVHTDLPGIGRFLCSDETLNQIQAMTRNSYLTNWHSFPEDCPQREKCGWIGDAWMAAEAGLLYFDVARSLAKWLDDIADAQREDGAISAIVPTPGWGFPPTSKFGTVNSSGFCILPWLIYQYTGDETPIVKHYAAMKRYVEFLGGEADGGIIEYGLGDWLAPWVEGMSDRAAVPMLSTAQYLHCLRLVGRAAELVGRVADARTLSDRAEDVRNAINEHFLDAETGTYPGGSQTTQACAIVHDLAPQKLRSQVAAGLVRAVRDHENHLSTGLIGTWYLINALSQIGRDDLMYAVTTRPDYPGWGCWVEHGATTLWERWNGTASRNHPWSAHICAWMIRSLGGIRPEAPGFGRIRIAPRPVGDLTSVEAEHKSPYGLIRSHWELDGEDFELRVTIPPNTAAVIDLPGRDACVISGEAGVRNGAFRCGSGEYAFQSTVTSDRDSPGPQ